MNKCCKKCDCNVASEEHRHARAHCMLSTCPCHSQEKPEEATASGWEELDKTRFKNKVATLTVDGREWVPKEQVAKERTQAKKEILNQVLDIIHETDPSTGRGTSKIYWGNVLREKVSALLPEQESK